jgi:uncharacterized protein (DUF983 family)
MAVTAEFRPTTWTALSRGFVGRCPRCGRGALFRAFLKFSDRCSACDLDLGEIRSDDIPAYFTILVVGHVVVPLLLLAEIENFSGWSVILILGPVGLALTFLLLPRIKGAVAGLLWSLGIAGGAPT